MKYVSTGEKLDSYRSDQDISSPSASSEPTRSPINISVPPDHSHSSLGNQNFQSLSVATAFNTGPFQRCPSQLGVGLELRSFSMWTGKPKDTSDIDDNNSFHSYTRADGKILARILPLERLPSWKTRFPRVFEILRDEREANINRRNCSVIHSQTSIKIMTTKPLTNSILGAQVEVALPGSIFIDCKWECTTWIYAHGKKVWELSQDCQ
jgi:hypothetical protein